MMQLYFNNIDSFDVSINKSSKEIDTMVKPCVDTDCSSSNSSTSTDKTLNTKFTNSFRVMVMVRYRKIK